jgi:hypothetical protein
MASLDSRVADLAPWPLQPKALPPIPQRRPEFIIGEVPGDEELKTASRFTPSHVHRSSQNIDRKESA